VEPTGRNGDLDSPTAKQILALNNVEVIYDQVILVLRGLSLAVREGEIVALLGSNGAGKSTTLRKLGFPIIVAHSHGARNTTHQCGTLVFGHDPTQSVLDTYCRAHDVENLFVVDASFFPSSAAVNPGLTIVAQALRVADHIKQHDLGLKA
jgi:choline dehydrogenase-like flavoprotein